MTKEKCELCRWWIRGLRHPEYGACENEELATYLTGRAHFSPHKDFSCQHFESSQCWIDRAAKEIDGWFTGAHGTLPDNEEQRVSLFSKIIAKHRELRDRVLRVDRSESR